MGANSHLSPHQLRMFMSPAELMQLPMADAYDGETQYDTISRVYEEASLPEGARDKVGDVVRGAGVADSVRQHGVHTPVTVFHDEDGSFFSDGHHRLSAAYHVRPDQLIPVEHEDEENW